MSAQTVVYKWAVPVDDQTHHFSWSEAVEVVHVAPDAAFPDVIYVWTRQPVDTGETRNRSLRVYGTGQPIDDPSAHLGTAVTSVGLVWHLVELL